VTSRWAHKQSLFARFMLFWAKKKCSEKLVSYHERTRAGLTRKEKKRCGSGMDGGALAGGVKGLLEGGEKKEIGPVVSLW